MNVLKFGGTSVANAQNISLVKNIVYQNAYTKQYVVVSALGGITDLLLDTAAAAANGAGPQGKPFAARGCQQKEVRLPPMKAATKNPALLPDGGAWTRTFAGYNRKPWPKGLTNPFSIPTGSGR